MNGRLIGVAAVALCAATMLACGADDRSATAALPPVNHPDFGQFEPGLGARFERALNETTGKDGTAGAAAWSELGLLYQAHGLHLAAAACFDSAARLDPRDHRWPYARGFMLHLEGRLDEARAAYLAALAIAPSDLTSLLRIGRLEHDAARPDEAQRWYETVLATTPGQPAALAGLGDVARQRGEHERALELLTRALAAEPAATQLNYPIALSLRALGRSDEARAALARRGLVKPRVPDPLLARALALTDTSQQNVKEGLDAFNAGDYERAASLYGRALNANPNMIDTRLSYAWTLELLGRFDDASRENDAVIAADDRQGKAFYLRGRLRERAGDDTAAIAAYERAIDIEPDAGPPRERLASALMRKRRFAESASQYERLARLAPAQAGNIFFAGVARGAAGDCAGAARAFDAASKINPRSAENAEAQIRTWATCPALGNGRIRRAVSLGKALHDALPEPDYAAAYAMALAADGRFADAIALLDGALAGLVATDPRRARLESQRQRYRGETASDSPWPPGHPVLAPPRLTAGD